MLHKIRSTAARNHTGAMEAENHVKHGANSKSLMSRKNFLGLIFCLVAAASVSMSACNKDKDDESGGGKNGILTIKGIPTEYNGKYVIIEGYGNDEAFSMLSGHQRESGETQYFVKISGGEAKVPMWRLNNSFKFVAYTGNDEDVSLYVEIFNEAFYDWSSSLTFDLDLIMDWVFEEVEFTNGNATVNWKDGKTRWVSDEDLAEFGLAGMPKPTGARLTSYGWWSSSITAPRGMNISFEGHASTAQSVKSYFENSNNGWTLDKEDETSKYYKKEDSNAKYDVEFAEYKNFDFALKAVRTPR